MNMTVHWHVSTNSTKATLPQTNDNGMSRNVSFNEEFAWLNHINGMDRTQKKKAFAINTFAKGNAWRNA